MQRGTIPLPAGEVWGIRKTLVRENNRYADAGLVLAKRAWAAASPEQQLSPQAMRGILSRDEAAADPAVATRAAAILGIETVGLPRAPMKLHAGHLRAATRNFGAGTLTVKFTGPVVGWSVTGGLDGVEDARQTWLGKTLRDRLAGIGLSFLEPGPNDTVHMAE